MSNFFWEDRFIFLTMDKGRGDLAPTGQWIKGEVTSPLRIVRLSVVGSMAETGCTCLSSISHLGTNTKRLVY